MNPAYALLAGMLLALGVGLKPPAWAKGASRPILQASVVLLGFTLDFGAVWQAGVQGAGFALASFAIVFGLGHFLGRWLRVPPNVSLLVCSGTAICGGSAIAAMSSVVDAEPEDTAVATATVFLLNAAALFLFPPLGHLLGMSPASFGIWAGIAIHDVASVVGAAAVFGSASLATATAVKLSRVLFLIPLAFGTALLRRKGGDKVSVPWFVALFLLASLARQMTPWLQEAGPWIGQAAKIGLSLSLFLIGLGVTRAAVAKVGWRPLALGMILWAILSLGALVPALHLG